MTTEEARAKIALFDAMKRDGFSDDEIWTEVLEGLTNDEILEVAQAAMDSLLESVRDALADGENPRMLHHILMEHIVE